MRLLLWFFLDSMFLDNPILRLRRRVVIASPWLVIYPVGR